MTDADVRFLEEAARYFERRPTNGEDSAHWANVHNARRCREIAAHLSGRPREGGAKRSPNEPMTLSDSIVEEAGRKENG